MLRRHLLRTGAAAAFVPRVARAQSAGSTLRYVPSANLTFLDPVRSSAYVSLCHGYAVFDALYGVDRSQKTQPQMAEGHTVSDDGLVWLIRLRDGLRFHDGEPVRAADCAASLARWCACQPIGQVVGAFVESWSASDDRTIRVTLKRRLPSLIDMLATSVFPPFIMPERLARTDPSKLVTEMVGSGPFRYAAGDSSDGQLFVYTRFAEYTPRPEAPNWTSGGKVVKVDRLEWHIIPDASTAADALVRGEVDWLERPLSDLLPMLRQRKDIVVGITDPTGWIGYLRFNCLQPPFDNELVRQAVMDGVNQADFMRIATADDPSRYTVCPSMFPCGTAMGTPVGAAAMPASLEQARAKLKQSGYNGERVVLLDPTDNFPLDGFAELTADLFKQMGMNVDMVSTDWGTVTQRRLKKEPVDQGGWSAFVSAVNGPAIMNPGVNFLIRGQGASGFAGWFASEKIEKLAGDWLQAETQTDRMRLSDAIQEVAFKAVPYVPLGQYVQPTVYRRELSGILQGPAVLPWNISKS